MSWFRSICCKEGKYKRWRDYSQFAEALEVVPSTLAENAGLDASVVISELMEKYSEDIHCGFGVDIDVYLNEG